MKKLLSSIVLGLLLSGCLATPQSNSLKPVVNSDIREIALMPMGQINIAYS